MSCKQKCKSNFGVLNLHDKLTVYDVTISMDDIGSFTFTRDEGSIILSRRCEYKLVQQTEILDGDEIKGLNRYEFKFYYDKSLKKIKENHIISLDTEVNEDNQPLLLYVQGLPARVQSGSNIGRMMAIEIGHQ